MLNVSATLELERRIAEQNGRIEAQVPNLARLRQQLSALEAPVRAAGRVEPTRVADAGARPQSRRTVIHTAWPSAGSPVAWLAPAS